MVDQESEQRGTKDSLDRITLDLRRLRQQAGDVAYGEIARRIAKHREANGVDPVAARPARTTVYDAFRTGRSRINAQLVGEIARALGEDDAEATRWEHRCLTVRGSSEPAQEHQPAPSTAHEPATEREEESARAWTMRPAAFRAVLALTCLGINFVGYASVELLRIPLYLDSIGTGIAAMVLGPWWGVAVGVSTNALGSTIHGSMALPFALQSAAFALVWGYGARRLDMTRTIGSYFSLNMYVGLSHTFIAVPLTVLVFGGGTGHAGDAISHHLAELGVPLLLSVYAGHMVLALADALLAGFVILTVIATIKTKPPFRGQCDHLFPFSAPPDIPRALARVATAVTRPEAAAARNESTALRTRVLAELTAEVRDDVAARRGAVSAWIARSARQTHAVTNRRSVIEGTV